MPGARVWCWPGFHWWCKAKVLFIQLSFLCVQFRYNYMCCSVSDSFVFLIINRQHCSCLAWLVFLGGLPGVALLGTWYWCCCLNCLPPPVDDEALVVRDSCSVPASQEAWEEYAKCVVPSQTQPILCCLPSLFSTDPVHRSHNPGHCSCWSDLCYTRHFSSIHSSNRK